MMLNGIFWQLDGCLCEYCENEPSLNYIAENVDTLNYLRPDLSRIQMYGPPTCRGYAATSFSAAEHPWRFSKISNVSNNMCCRWRSHKQATLLQLGKSAAERRMQPNAVIFDADQMGSLARKDPLIVPYAQGIFFQSAFGRHLDSVDSISTTSCQRYRDLGWKGTERSIPES